MTLVGAGITVFESLAAADALAGEGIAVRVIDAYSVKPIDGETLRRALEETGLVVTVEDHWREGGLGDAVLEALAARGPLSGRVHKVAVADMPGSGTPEELRDWFDAYHETAEELWVGYHKKATGRPTVTWSQAVDEALCVGWIDSVRYSLGPEASAQRFMPRRKGSIWSAVNVAKVESLLAEGRMRPAGKYHSRSQCVCAMTQTRTSRVLVGSPSAVVMREESVSRLAAGQGGAGAAQSHGSDALVRPVALSPLVMLSADDQ